MSIVRLPTRAPGLGGKGAALSRLLELGFAVPPAVVVTADVAPSRGTPLDPALAGELASAAKTVGDRLAVRSSAVGEDSATRSFAGMFDTVLDVAPEDVAAAVARCWSSLWSTRAESYRASVGVTEPPSMAVVVQRLVRAETAGVAFTCDPVAQRSDRVIVEAVRGLGEALVSGRVAPERWSFERPSLTVLERPDANTARGAVLSERAARDIAELALSVEAELGGSQDIEWAREGELTWLLQARPVTTALKRRIEVWSNTNTAELLPGVATVMTFELVEAAVKALLRPLLKVTGLDLDASPIIGRVGGRIYFSINTLVGVIRAIPGMRRTNPAELFGGDRVATERAIALLGPEDLPQVHVSKLRLLSGVLRMARLLWKHRAVGPEALDGLRALRMTLEGERPEAYADEALVPRIRRLLADASSGEDGLSSTLAGMVAVDMLQKLCRLTLGNRDGSLASRLMQAVGGLDSAEAGDALWRLVEPARLVEATLAQGTWRDLRPALEATAEGRRFVEAFDGFLSAHGHHVRGEIDVAIPRWREDPDGVLTSLRAFLRAPAADPLAVRARRAEEREVLERDCRRRLWWPVSTVFDALLARARRGFALRENVKNEAVRVLFTVRRLILSGGARLTAAGRLLAVDDVMSLTLDELDQALTGRLTELAPRVDRRKRALERDRRHSPPAVVIGAWDGTDATAPAPTSALKLTGIAASPGIAEGRVRVILAGDSDARVLPGEILVAPFTDPGWTPYFIAAAGIVVDIGGVFSHGSIVAREYGLPAVVNVGHATRTLRTGQLVRVDGTRGEVLVLEPSDAE